MKINFDTQPAAPDTSNDLAVRYAAARRKVPRWRWYLIVLVLLALPVYYGIRFMSDLLVTSAPGFVQMKQVSITAGAAGHVVKILPEGTHVNAEEIIARILPDSSNSSVTELNRARTSEKVIQTMRAALNLQHKVVALQRDKVHVIQKLLSQGAATAADLAAAQSQLFTVESSAIRARAALERVDEQPLTSLSTTTAVKAPFSGHLLRVLVYQNQWVAPDTNIVTLRSNRPPWIEAFLNPKDIRYARLGTHATVIFSNGWHVQAVVSSVAKDAGRLPPQYSKFFQQRGNAVQVKLRLTKPLPESYMIFDMPVKVQFRLISGF